MLAFVRTLPKIRKAVARDMRKAGLPREKVLATVIRLMETTLIRVGNDEYAKQNHSYGLTTLRDKHAQIKGPRIKFNFRGKSGKHHDIELDDKRLATIVRRCRDLPGYELFQYLDDDGQPRTIDSYDVNEYLRAITGEEYTAKDFRTWAGTVLAALALQELQKFDSATQAKRNVLRAIEAVAQRLGNTPSICRKCYVHPALLDAYVNGSLVTTLAQRAEELREPVNGLESDEVAVLEFLQQRLAGAE
jgi:DNA topoisomerase-1